MSAISESKHLRKFLVIDSLFEGGRMFVGATSVTYLLSIGISFKEIAALKSIQAFVLIFGEVPTGILADSFGRKLSLILSGICAICGFLVYYFSSTFAYFGLAETLTALSLCFWSGAYESCAIDTAKLEHTEGSLNRFFHLNMSCNSASVMVAGLIGGYIGLQGINLPYLGAVFCYLLMLGLIATLPSEIGHDGPAGLTYGLWFAKIKTHSVAAVKEGLLHPVLLPFFLANIGIQFLIQPILHYWQPLFQAISPSISSGQQGWIFSAYCGTTSIFAFIYSKFSNKPFVKSPFTVALLFSVFSLLYFILPHVDHLIIGIVVFCVLQGFLSLCRTSLSIKMNEVIDSKSRSSILSTLSLISRLGMMGALAVIARIVNKDESSSIIHLFKLFGGMSFILIILLMLGMRYSKRNNEI